MHINGNAVIDQFRDAMQRAGMSPPDVIAADGRLHRFATNGKASDSAGWYVLHGDGPIPAGAFGDWRSGASETWRCDIGRTLTPDEESAHRTRVAAIRTERDAEAAQQQQLAAEVAEQLLGTCAGDPGGHPYAVRKGIALGLLVKRGPWEQRGWPDALLIPIYGSEGTVWSLQAINADGEKDYLRGGRKSGGFHPFGKIRGSAGTIVIGEGVATVAAVVDAVGCPGVAAMDSGNLGAAARAIRELAPSAELVFLADNDMRPDGSNPGVKAAHAAAKAVGGRVIVPELDGRACDFWDLRHARGSEFVRAAVAHHPHGVPLAGLICAADIKPEPISWLMEGWLAGGALHVIAGAPGTGKTTVALAFAATVSSGGKWPDGTIAAPADVLIWSSEDDPRRTLIPRLRAMGADVRRIHVVESAKNADGSTRPFDPGTDIPQLSAAFRAMRRTPRLLIVDPIVAAVTRDGNDNASTRRSLQPLVDLGQMWGCAVLGISHFSKGTAGRDVTERVTGSLAYGALARVVFAVVKLPEDKGGARLIVRAKSNLGPDAGGFEYSLSQVAIPEYPGIVATSLSWGPAVDGTARELLAQAEASEGHEEKAERLEIMDWLKDLLTPAPLTARDVKAKAEQQGFAWRSVQRARSKAGFVSRRQGFGKDSCIWWSLNANEPIPHAIGAIGANPERVAPMAPMEARPAEMEGGEI